MQSINELNLFSWSSLSNTLREQGISENQISKIKTCIWDKIDLFDEDGNEVQNNDGTKGDGKLNFKTEYKAFKDAIFELKDNKIEEIYTKWEQVEFSKVKQTADESLNRLKQVKTEYVELNVYIKSRRMQRLIEHDNLDGAAKLAKEMKEIFETDTPKTEAQKLWMETIGLIK